MMRSIVCCLLVFAPSLLAARTLHVGSGRPYANPALAARKARAGDTILVHDGTHRGTFWWVDLVGSGRRSSYDFRRSNVRGGLGVWGSASLVKARTFLLKNR